MADLSQLPTRLQGLTQEIKERERVVETLRVADRTTYKTYVRARTELASKKYQNIEDEGTKKWYKLWIKCADEMQVLAVQIEQEEAALVELKQTRADRVAQDRISFEAELLAR